jgi:hypothetical protein
MNAEHEQEPAQYGARGQSRASATLAIVAFLLAATLCVYGFVKIVPMLLDNPAKALPAERTNTGARTPGWSTALAQFGSPQAASLPTTARGMKKPLF